MGKLIEGVWHEDTYKHDSAGRFVRWDSAFRRWVTPAGEQGFPADTGRYHLYVSYACPWAHRALIVRALKGLERAISVDVVHWHMAWGGWPFTEAYPDTVNGANYLHEVYIAADPTFTGRVTVPTLWDTKQATIVNNESADLVRMLNSAFDAYAEHPEVDLYPEGLRDEIDAVNERVYADINNGVYKAGFATTQAAYEEAVSKLFDALDWLEAKLDGQPYLAGGRLTEADIRLFTTLVRFDPVYVGHFKCNKHRLVDYPNLWALTRAIYQIPAVRQTVRFDHIKNHYYVSHRSINPTGIVPIGPAIDFDAPVDRMRPGLEAATP